MSSELDMQRIAFYKDRIREQLLRVRNDIGEMRFKLYINFVEECDNYSDLREMAELEMQIELIEYTKTEIKQKLKEQHVEINDLRRVCDTSYDSAIIAEQEASKTAKEDNWVETEKSNLVEEYGLADEDGDDEEQDEEMSMLLAYAMEHRLANEPIEETEQLHTMAYEAGNPPRSLEDTLKDLDNISSEDFEGDLDDEGENFEGVGNRDNSMNSESEDELDSLAGYFDDESDELTTSSESADNDDTDLSGYLDENEESTEDTEESDEEESAFDGYFSDDDNTDGTPDTPNDQSTDEEDDMSNYYSDSGAEDGTTDDIDMSDYESEEGDEEGLYDGIKALELEDADAIFGPDTFEDALDELDAIAFDPDLDEIFGDDGEDAGAPNTLDLDNIDMDEYDEEAEAGLSEQNDQGNYSGGDDDLSSYYGDDGDAGELEEDSEEKDIDADSYFDDDLSDYFDSATEDKEVTGHPVVKKAQHLTTPSAAKPVGGNAQSGRILAPDKIFSTGRPQRIEPREPKSAETPEVPTSLKEALGATVAKPKKEITVDKKRADKTQGMFNLLHSAVKKSEKGLQAASKKIAEKAELGAANLTKKSMMESDPDDILEL